jgi:hypothetical protein
VIAIVLRVAVAVVFVGFIGGWGGPSPTLGLLQVAVLEKLAVEQECKRWRSFGVSRRLKPSSPSSPFQPASEWQESDKKPVLEIDADALQHQI